MDILAVGYVETLQHGFDGVPERRAVAGDISLDVKVVAREQDRAAVAANVTGHDDGIACRCTGARGAGSRLDLADARRGDEDVVDLAAARDLRIAGDDAHAGLSGRFFHVAGDGLEV